MEFVCAQVGGRAVSAWRKKIVYMRTGPVYRWINVATLFRAKIDTSFPSDLTTGPVHSLLTVLTPNSAGHSFYFAVSPGCVGRKVRSDMESIL